MTGVAVAAMALAASQARAQDAGAELAEVVVTATKSEGTVNSVPLSISAVTTRQLEQQGIKTVTDLARVVPGLSVAADSPARGNFTVRGLFSSSGAATTGVYLNDLPLQRRSFDGVNQLNGAPAPPLFDLERVEVLRGPQGTLYGGSSLGGTIRFITPTPSLTRYSAYARGEISATEESSGTNYEAGLAVGGPIIQDKLGFRASAYTRKDAGYIDLVSPYDNGLVRDKDANSSRVWAFQSSFKGALTDTLSATLFLYTSGTKVANSNSSYNLPIDPNYTTTGGLVTLRGRAGSLGPFGYLDKPFQSLARDKTPQSTRLTTPSLTIDWMGPGFSVQSITAYIEDESLSWNGPIPLAALVNGVASGPFGVTTSTNVPYNPLLKDAPGALSTTNRYGLSEELRLSTTGDGPFKLVAGLYASRFRTRSENTNNGDGSLWTIPLFGVPAQFIYGPLVYAPGTQGFGPVFTAQSQRIRERELAAFGELTYKVTPKLSALVGARISDNKMSYDSVLYGQLFGPSQRDAGTQKNTPFTPKFGLQYKLADDKLLYANMAKGFRTGGVNLTPPPLCTTGLNALGLTRADLPKTYGPDTVWNHEVGAKLRLIPGVQVNASAFLINWNDVQFIATLPGCSSSPTVNAGKARSQGFDLQADARLFEGLTASLAVGYTHGEYTETVVALIPKTGPATPNVLKGDKLPVAPWTFSASVNYEFPLAAALRGFVRADYQYASSYKRTFGAGASGYSPDIRNAEAADVVNVRAGVRTGRIEANLFVNNLFNSRDLLTEAGGRSGCTNAACTAYTTYNPFMTGSTFRPRTIGAQATYRY